MLQEFYENHMHRYTCPKSLTSASSSRCYALVICSVSNLPLLIIGDYYYSHNKMMKEKMETGQRYGMGIGGCNRLCSAANET